MQALSGHYCCCYNVSLWFWFFFRNHCFILLEITVFSRNHCFILLETIQLFLGTKPSLEITYFTHSLTDWSTKASLKHDLFLILIHILSINLNFVSSLLSSLKKSLNTAFLMSNEMLFIDKKRREKYGKSEWKKNFFYDDIISF